MKGGKGMRNCSVINMAIQFVRNVIQKQLCKKLILDVLIQLDWMSLLRGKKTHNQLNWLNAYGTAAEISVSVFTCLTTFLQLLSLHSVNWQDVYE